MIFKHINRLQQIDQLIRQQRTGNAEELAGKLNISRRQVYNWLEELKSYGVEIDYSREIKSFIYLKAYKINISIDIEELPFEETIKTSAGINIFKKNLLCNTIAQTQNIFEPANLIVPYRPVSSIFVC